jgi:tetratricopeptide (TPR) repeat protein
MNNRRVEVQEMIQLLVHMQQLLRQELELANQTGPSHPAQPFYQGLLALTLAALYHFTMILEAKQHIKLYMQESLKLIQNLPDNEAKAYTILLNCIGSNLASDQKLDLYQQCFRIFRGMGDTWGAALAQLLWADDMNFSGFDEDMARAAYQASLETFRQAKNIWGQALCLNGITILDYRVGHIDDAYQVGSQSIELYLQLGNFERIAGLRNTLGEIAIRKGLLDDARMHFEANLAYHTNLGDLSYQKYYQERLAALESGQAGGQR